MFYRARRVSKCHHCASPLLRSLSFCSSLSTSPTQEWQYVLVNHYRFQQAREVLAHMRRPTFLQSHITEESSGIFGLHFWMTDLTESFAATLRACAKIRPWIWIFCLDMIHVDWLHEPYNFMEIQDTCTHTHGIPVYTETTILLLIWDIQGFNILGGGANAPLPESCPPLEISGSHFFSKSNWTYPLPESCPPLEISGSHFFSKGNWT